MAMYKEKQQKLFRPCSPENKKKAAASVSAKSQYLLLNEFLSLAVYNI